MAAEVADGNHRQMHERYLKTTSHFHLFEIHSNPMKEGMEMKREIAYCSAPNAYFTNDGIWG